MYHEMKCVLLYTYYFIIVVKELAKDLMVGSLINTDQYQDH